MSEITNESQPIPPTTREEGEMAEIIVYPSDKHLTAVERCDRCNAQAYMRVELHNGKTLLFCAYHARMHEKALIANPSIKRIHDYRPWLHAEESGQRDAASAPK